MSARERLSDYLLDELSAEERARFEAELSGDPELAAEVARLRPVVVGLQSVEPAAWDPAVDVPPLRLPRAPAPARPRWWARPLVLRPAIAGAVTAAALALGVLGGLLLDDGDGAEDVTAGGRTIALAAIEPLGDRATGTATFAASGDSARLRVAGLAPSAAGEFYELWLLNSAENLVALGSFKVPASGAAQITVPLPADPGDFAAIDVSIEPADGDPAHSTRSVLRASLTAS